MVIPITRISLEVGRGGGGGGGQLGSGGGGGGGSQECWKWLMTPHCVLVYLNVYN